MARYIKQEYVLDAVSDVYYDTPDIDLSFEKFEAAILKIQAADVAPVRHGRWVPCDNGGYYCSYCDHRVAFLVHNRYCPNCGAKMEGDGR